jgi:hypothetical protein
MPGESALFETLDSVTLAAGHFNHEWLKWFGQQILL